MTTKTLTDTEHKLLAALWRLAFTRLSYDTDTWECGICGAHGLDKKTAARHASGCALFGLDPALLAGLDEWDKVGE